MARRKRKDRIEAKRKADLKKFFIVMALGTIGVLLVLYFVYQASQ